ncbi:MAG: hypothetical protein M1824_001695 [Vezdaea acicularis]|nr:MAG: hypothetical protein M1824_001695 [Vezdaea acicularis]
MDGPYDENPVESVERGSDYMTSGRRSDNAQGSSSWAYPRTLPPINYPESEPDLATNALGSDPNYLFSGTVARQQSHHDDAGASTSGACFRKGNTLCPPNGQGGKAESRTYRDGAWYYTIRGDEFSQEDLEKADFALGKFVEYHTDESGWTRLYEIVGVERIRMGPEIRYTICRVSSPEDESLSSWSNISDVSKEKLRWVSR